MFNDDGHIHRHLKFMEFQLDQKSCYKQLVQIIGLINSHQREAGET